jgi:AcrR family transcriptional regulator
MARSRRKAYHHGALRRALLDATLQLAAEKGPGAVSLREAARLAGVSPAAPYRHFGDKQEMLAAASEEGFRLVLDRVRDAAVKRSSPTESLVEWVALYVRFAVEHPAHFRLMYGQGSPPKSTTGSLQAAARQTFRAFFETVEEVAAPWRLDAATLRELALGIWALAHGMAMLALDGQTLFLGVPPEQVQRVARQAASAHLEALSRSMR